MNTNSAKDEFRARIGSRHGSILLVMLCIIAVLSFLIVTTASLSKQHGDMQLARQGGMRARQLAEMGVAVAVHPMIKVGDPLLRRKVSGVEGYEVFLSTEESRLNLNALLTEQHLPVFEQVLKSWGLSVADAQGIASTFLDWTDADDLKRRPDSAERLDYERLGFADRPFNRRFISLDEAELVARAEEIRAVRPDWRSFFTLRGSGQLDVNTASAEVLAAATGASLENAKLVVSKRNGLDGLPQTTDDVSFKSVEEVIFLLGVTGQQATEVMSLLTLQGTMRRVESVGIAGDTRCGIGVVLQSGGGASNIVEWREFNVVGGKS